MADRQFRFRLPWLIASRPTAGPQPPRPTADIQPPARPVTTIPIPRPPFQPPGIAPVELPPTQAREPPRTESQPTTLPPSVITESQVTSQTASPSRTTTRTQATSVPPSPSRAAQESQVTSQTALPSGTAPPSRATSPPPSPSRIVAGPQPAVQTTSQPQSPSHLATQQVGQKSSPPSSPSRMGNQVQPTVSQPSPPKTLQHTSPETTRPPPFFIQLPSQLSAEKETKLGAPLPVPGATQPKPEITSETEAISKSQNQTQPIQPSTTETATPNSTQAPETPTASQKPDPKTTGVDHPLTLPQPVNKLEETEREKVEEFLKKAGKTGPGAQAKVLLSAAFDAESRPQKEDTVERKKKTAISSNIEQIKIAKGRHTLSESHVKPDTSIKETVPLHKEIKEDISRFVHKLGTVHPMQPIGQKPVSIVTLAGENRGAALHLGTASVKKDESSHSHRGYKTNTDNTSETTTDGEGTSKERGSRDLLTKEDLTPTAHINSNTQCINNSIMFESSANERNPGVQLILSQNPAEFTILSTKQGFVDTRKAEFSITPAEKLTCEL